MSEGRPLDQLLPGPVRDSLRWAHRELVNRGKRRQREGRRRANRYDDRAARTAQTQAHGDFMAADLLNRFITDHAYPTEKAAR